MNGRKILRLVIAVVLLVGLVAGTGYTWSRLQSRSRAVSLEHRSDISAPATDPARFNLGTYNIAHGRGGIYGASNWSGSTADKVERLKKIAALLASLDLDVVVLNEVDFSSVWSGHRDQATIIAEAGGYPYIARQRNIDAWLPFFELRFGNAVLSRYPITAAELRTFEPYSRLETVLLGNHDALLTRLALPSGPVALWALHLEHRNRATRVAAATDVLRAMAGIEEPVFIAGDLNSRLPGSLGGTGPGQAPTATSLLMGMHGPGPVPGLTAFPTPKADGSHKTFPSQKPDRIIDWIFYPDPWRLVSGSVVQSPLSDHLPVVVSLTLDHSDHAETSPDSKSSERNGSS